MAESSAAAGVGREVVYDISEIIEIVDAGDEAGNKRLRVRRDTRLPGEGHHPTSRQIRTSNVEVLVAQPQPSV